MKVKLTTSVVFLISLIFNKLICYEGSFGIIKPSNLTGGIVKEIDGKGDPIILFNKKKARVLLTEWITPLYGFKQRMKFSFKLKFIQENSMGENRFSPIYVTFDEQKGDSLVESSLKRKIKYADYGNIEWKIAVEYESSKPHRFNITQIQPITNETICYYVTELRVTPAQNEGIMPPFTWLVFGIICPLTVVLACFVCCVIVLLVTRFMGKRKKSRDFHDDQLEQEHV